jgi:hypothetical protein
VSGAEEGQKVSDIYRALQTGFADVLASEPWQATYRGTEDVVAEALREVGRGAGTGSASLELAARAAFPLVVSRQLFPDRGTRNNDQVDRRQPGTVIDRMRNNEWGIRQLGQAITDHAVGRRIRAVSPAGELIPLDNGDGEQIVTDNWLRQTFPPPGRPVAPAAPDTAHERYLDAMARLGEAMDAVDRAVRRLVAVEGVDGRPLIQTEGVDPADAGAWLEDVMKLMQLIPVWRNTHVSRYGASRESAWGAAGDADSDLDQEDADDEASSWDYEEEAR